MGNKDCRPGSRRSDCDPEPGSDGDRHLQSTPENPVDSISVQWFQNKWTFVALRHGNVTNPVDESCDSAVVQKLIWTNVPTLNAQQGVLYACETTAAICIYTKKMGT